MNNKERVKREIEKINNMSHFEMAKLWRYSPIGHEYFDVNLPYFEVFMDRFRDFGGMTAEISKQIEKHAGR